MAQIDLWFQGLTWRSKIFHCLLLEYQYLKQNKLLLLLFNSLLLNNLLSIQHVILNHILDFLYSMDVYRYKYKRVCHACFWNIKIPLTKMYNEVDVIRLSIFALSLFPHVCHSDCTLFALKVPIAFSSVHEYNPVSPFDTSRMDNWLQEGFILSSSPPQIDRLYFPIL